MTATNILQFQETLRHASPEDMSAFVRMINAEINRRSRINTARFMPGDKVTWRGKTGMQMTGTVQKSMQKRCKVLTASHGVWLVSGSLLQRA